MNLKKVLIRSLQAGIAAGLVFVMSQAVFASSLNDLDKSSDYAKAAISDLLSKGIVSGDQYGNFNPHSTITRAQMVKILVNALGADTASLPAKPTFKDVPADNWAYKYVEAAYRAGIVKGISADTFGAAQFCTREQMAVLFTRALGLSDEVVNSREGQANLEAFGDKASIDTWAKGYVDFAVSSGLMNGTGSASFGPVQSAQREQAAVITERYLSQSGRISGQSKGLKTLQIVVNGDVVDTKGKAVVQGGDVLVPLDVFTEMGAQVSADTASGTAMIEIADQSKSTKYCNIWLKDGASFAYSDYLGQNDPFAQASVQTGQKVDLTVPAKTVGGELLVPVIFTVKSLGEDVTWNADTQTVTISSGAQRELPGLFGAMRDNVDYKGDISLKMHMAVDEKVSGEHDDLAFNATGKVNGQDMDLNAAITDNGGLLGGEPGTSLGYEVIMKNGQAYVKGPDGKWQALTQDQLDSSGLSTFTQSGIQANSTSLIDNYKDLDFGRIGTQAVNGEVETVYGIELTSDEIAKILPGSVTGAGSDLKTLYNKGVKLTLRIYLNQDGQIVRETEDFTAGTKDSTQDMDIKITIDASCSNIGKVYDIEAPAVSPQPV